MGRRKTQKSNQVGQRVLFGVIAAIIGICVLISPRALVRSRHPIVPAHFKLDREIALDLRLGSSKQQVMDYCRTRGWDSYDRGRTVTAINHVPEQNMIIRNDVTITFEFDAEDNLISFHSEDHYTGP